MMYTRRWYAAYWFEWMYLNYGASTHTYSSMFQHRWVRQFKAYEAEVFARDPKHE